MAKPLKVLIVEDSEDDALLIAHHLGQAGFEVRFERVETAEAMEAALTDKTWDVILCDYKLPEFAVLPALRVMTDAGCDLPFIVVSGVMGEESAAEFMRAGAHDVILKENLSRLVPAIERELVDVIHRRDRKSAEEASRRLTAAIEPLIDGVAIYDADDRLVFWNEAYRKHHEGELEKLLKPGLKFEDLVRARAYSGEAPEAIGREEAFIADRMERHGKPGQQFEIPRKDRWFIYRESPIPDGGTIIIITDITERKEAEDQLRKLSLVVEGSPAGVVITDSEGTIEYVNPKFIEITGYSAEEAVGRNPRILKSGETPEADYERLWATITAGKEWRGTLRNKHKNGTIYLAGVSIAPIKAADGTITNFVSAHQDITQRVGDERRLKHAEKMDTLGNLAGGIAHDFNNMLLPILSLTDMTRNALPEDSRERKRLDKVVEAATRAKDLVTRILAFSHEEDALRENIDIYGAIREAMDFLRSTLPTTIKVSEHLDPDTGIVLADRAQVVSVLMNLANNAADAMDGGTGEMAVSLSPVKVSKKNASSITNLDKGSYAKLVVKDNGHGMKEKTLEKVMEPFFTTKPVGEGTGLGLSMVHGIVSKHGGAIDISSAQDKGTTVEVYLPLVEEQTIP